MAGFHTHISVGVIVGIINVLLVVAFSLAPVHIGFLMLVIGAAGVGSVLPDMDSDTGVPYHVAFGSLSFVAAIFACVFAWRYFPAHYGIIIAAPITALFVVWAVVGPVFKKCTRHRGMMHSIPMALIVGMVLFSFAARLGFSDWFSFLLGVSMAIGFLSHLLLDELYSLLNPHGKHFVPNKAFGTAFKLFSSYTLSTALTYIVLITLLVGNYSLFSELSQKLSQGIIG